MPRTVSRFVVPALVVVSFALGCVVATSMPEVMQTTASAGELPTRWEYLELRPPITHQKREEKMNELGAEGWEYVGMVGADFVVFKRPVG